MAKLVLSFITFLILLEGFIVKAQSPIRFETISLEQGLSQSVANCVFQDSRGFIWVGTNDGLNKFDGYNFTIYRYDPKNLYSITNNVILRIYEDHTGKLWISTGDSKLNCYDPQTQQFISYRNTPDLPPFQIKDAIVSILEDKNNVLWLGTTVTGLCGYDLKTSKFQCYPPDKTLPNTISDRWVKWLYLDKEDNLWLATDVGLNKFDNKTQHFKKYFHDPQNPNSLSDNRTNNVFQDSKNRLWIGTNNGLNLFNSQTESFKVYKHIPENPNSINHNEIYQIIEDPAGFLWVATLTGLNKFDPDTETFTTYTPDPKDPTSLPNNHIKDLCLDKSNILWIATEKGVSKYDPKYQNFTVIRKDPYSTNALSSNYILSICEDDLGRLWIGTVDGLNIYNPKTKQCKSIHKNETPEGLKGNDIRALTKDKEGRIWIATSDGGLAKYDPKTDSVNSFTYAPKDPERTRTCWTLLADRKGDMWFSAARGLDRYNPETGEIISFPSDPKNPNSVSGDFITVLYEDTEGNIWVGTYQDGLNKYDIKTNKFIQFHHNPNDPTSISNDQIKSVYQDKTGTIWIGTRGGLNRYNKETQNFSSIIADPNKKDWLPNDVVYGILEDKAGCLWLSTNKGLSKFNPQTTQFKNYDAKYGLQDNEFNTGAYFKSKTGEFFFGGINGLTTFYPEKIKDNLFVPPIAITSLKVTNSKGEPVFSLKSDIAPNKTIELEYYQNFLFIEFAALDFSLPSHNRYQYQMDTVDTERKDTSRRFVEYPNLAPGEYTFHVWGTNNEGIGNPQGSTIKILIIPPLWKRWWAYLLYSLGFAGFIYAGVRYRLQVLQKQNVILESKVSERTNELAKMLIELQKNNDELDKANKDLDKANKDLDKSNKELIESNQRADRIFSALAEALPGTVLDGKYRLESKIGIGGFGVVYKATHLAMKRFVAVKIFRPAQGNDSAESLERFRLEAISTSRVNHPNVVAILDSGISPEGIAYLVMELLNGHTLKEELKLNQQLSLEKSALILIQVCQALSTAHETGIVHRDIKPDNIFLNQSPNGIEVKILDFGIAKLQNSFEGLELQSFTATGKIIGTPTYMAPERIANLPYNGSSDVYSVGIMFYEMLAGYPPFQGGILGVIGLINMHMQQEPTPLSKVLPEIPQEIETLSMMALAKKPETRPTAKAFADILISFLDNYRPKINESVTSNRHYNLDKELVANPAFIQTNSVSKNVFDTENKLLVQPQEKGHWKEIEELFYQLLELQTVEQEQWFNSYPNPNTTVYKEVKSLWDAHKEEEANNKFDVLFNVLDRSLNDSLVLLNSEEKNLLENYELKDKEENFISISFSAICRKTDKQVAIKVFDPKLLRNPLVTTSFNDKTTLSNISKPTTIIEIGIINSFSKDQFPYIIVDCDKTNFNNT